MIVFINAPHGLAQPQLFRRFVGIAALATDSPIGQVACFEEPALFTPIGIVYDDPDGLARWPQVNERNSQTVTKTFFERLPKNFQGDILLHFQTQFSLLARLGLLLCDSSCVSY